MSKKKTFGNLGQVDNIGGLSNLIADTSSSIKKVRQEDKPVSNPYIIKTFNIAEDDFLYIKKYVKFRRMQGDTDYTQKEALGEAIRLLKLNTPDLS
jgi:hypothetical protein